ncbi:MAG: MoaD family protein [Candidatus Hadarchaeales archaeon]
MRIKVKPWGIFQEIIGGRELEVNLPERVKLRDLLDELIERFGEKLANELFQPGGREVKPYIKILLNGHGAELEAELKDGDSVALFPPVGGG